MSQDVSLQADVGALPTNSVALLNTLSPLLKALSADNVHPLAVVQVEAIGSCFHINGKMAEKIPDLLVRSPSHRLQRLSNWVGWHAGDTASALAQTAGGRASALLCLVLGEVFDLGSVGQLLYQLSTGLIPTGRQHSSMSQLSQVASTLSQKLGALGFGSHLAFHVTRIREVYFNSGLDIPPNLLSTPSIETMVQFLQALSKALCDESAVLHWEGTEGVGIILSIVMAICPDDAWVSVENELISKGDRRSVVISIKAEGPTRFSLETLLHGTSTRSTPHLVVLKHREVYDMGWSLNMKWEGSLADSIDLKLLSVGARSTYELRVSLVELIAAVVFSRSGDALSNRSSNISETGVFNSTQRYSEYPDVPLPDSGLKGLLGPHPINHVRERLLLLFLAEPSFALMDSVLAYHNLRVSVNALLSPSNCTCGRGVVQHGWGEAISVPVPSALERKCPVSELWMSLGSICVSAIAALFVDYGRNTCFSLSDTSMNLKYALGVGCPYFFNYSEGNLVARSFSSIYLHKAILGIVGPSGSLAPNGTIGASSGSVSIYPINLESPSFTDSFILRYRLVDGIFHDGKNFLRLIETERCDLRPLADSSLIQDGSTPIVPSYMGSHDTLTMTARMIPMGLSVRTGIQIDTHMVWVDFLAVHLATMSVSIAKPCAHNRNEALAERYANAVAVTSVAAPLLKFAFPWPLRFAPPRYPPPIPSINKLIEVPSSSSILEPALGPITPGSLLESSPSDGGPWPTNSSPPQPNPFMQPSSTPSPPSEQRRLSLTLTHRNPEAQFLCCVYGIRTLFQGGSCLNCAIEQALREEFQMVIQS